MLLFSEIAQGLVWLGKEVIAVKDWIQKVVKTADEVEQDAATMFISAPYLHRDRPSVLNNKKLPLLTDLEARDD